MTEAVAFRTDPGLKLEATPLREVAIEIVPETITGRRLGPGTG